MIPEDEKKPTQNVDKKFQFPKMAFDLDLFIANPHIQTYDNIFAL